MSLQVAARADTEVNRKRQTRARKPMAIMRLPPCRIGPILDYAEEGDLLIFGFSCRR
jgi:hypothetical protein